jgi:shikimate kinase/3-dehydroquinate synthase
VSERVTVALGERAYDVWFEATYARLAEAIAPFVGGRTVAVVADPAIRASVLPGVAARIAEAGARDVRSIDIPSGEAAKTWEVAGSVLERLLLPGFDRTSVMVAVGGGATGDLAGFCAAVALRGVDWVQVPTTLLAMVDASVGGKTAVDHPRGKNLIGAFHQPRLVYAAQSALASLPERELGSGLGEVLKTAILAGDPLWTALRTMGAGAPFDRAPECVRYKAAFVADDERETAPGKRALLNLGHTVGHALEALSRGELPHGHAVALGLVAEARVAVELGLADPGWPEQIRELARILGLPVVAPRFDASALEYAMRLDKKADGDILCIPLSTGPGAVALARLSAARLAVALENPS